MLRIRDAQLVLFDRLALERFEARTAEALRTYWPGKCRDLGDEGVRASIRQGIERAKKYGIRSQRDVFRFLNLTYYLGADFDTGEAYPWARMILTNPDLSGAEKLGQLVGKALTVPLDE